MSNECYGVIIDHKLFIKAETEKTINIKVKDSRKSLTTCV